MVDDSIKTSAGLGKKIPTLRMPTKRKDNLTNSNIDFYQSKRAAQKDIYAEFN